MVETERTLLNELGYNLYGIMEHPHKFILYYISAIFETPNKELAQKAWNYLNDSLRLDICVRFRAQSIATAAIYMSARTLQIPLPENPPWWDLFNTTEKEIAEIANAIQGLYSRPKMEWVDPVNPKSFFNKVRSNLRLQ